MVYIDMVGTKPMYYRNKREYGYSMPTVPNDELVLSQNRMILEDFSKRGNPTNLLSNLLSLPCELGLYEIFSYFFEGKIDSDFDMVEAIFRGLIKSSEYCFCFCVNSTFCWFTVKDGSVKSHGKLQFSFERTKYYVGKFIKRLIYSIVSTGFNVSNIKFLFWSNEDYLPEFQPYIVKYDLLNHFFERIDGLRNIDMIGVMQLLSINLHDKYQATAWDFVDCLAEGANLLGLRQKRGILYANKVYYKDFSSHIGSNLINKKGCTFGIILDCEGKSSGIIQDGLSEIGGIIYCHYGKVMLNVEMFVSDELSLIDTIKQVIQNTRDLSGCIPFSTKRIKVLTYGNNDELMLQHSLNKSGQKSAKVILNQLSFCDVSTVIRSFAIEESNVSENKLTLSSIATALGVQVIKPLHNPANDARTLFNILARMLRTSSLLDVYL